MADDGGEELTPATREELVEGLSFAMRYQGRRRVRDDHADSFMSRVAAERLVDHLRQSGYVVMKKPPAPPISDAAHRRRGPPLKD
jgi:hypothetical protein